MITMEQLEQMKEMGDLTGMEEEYRRMNNTARLLRSSPLTTKTGRDWGSNLGRAGAHIGATVNDYKASQLGDKIGVEAKGTVQRMIDALMKRQGGMGRGAVTIPFDDDRREEIVGVPI
jgi:hypothetical protein